MPTPRTSPKSARSPKPKARAVKAKTKTKAKAATKSKPAAKTPAKKAPARKSASRKTSVKDVKAKVTAATGKARKAVEPELERLKKASGQVEARLKAVSATVASKLAAFEDLAEQQLKSEKNQALLDKLEKDVDRLLKSADQQFGKVRGALDDELKDLKVLLDRSADKVIPAAKERIRKLMPEDNGAGDVWEFYKDKSSKWRWRLKDAEGESLGASNKAFKTRAKCVQNDQRFGYKGG